MNQPLAAIVGVGATEFSKCSGRSELALAIEACTRALADAGLAPAGVDGLVTFAVDHNDETAVARCLGIDSVSFFARTSAGGGGAPGTITLAAMAIATGKAKTVICYRALNGRSQHRFGQPVTGLVEDGVVGGLQVDFSWQAPFGMLTAASYMAHSARRYMYQYGATSEDFGRQAVIQRKYANNNPNAYFYDRPLTLEQHQASPWVADPLHLLDCCQESDGGVALVLTGLDRARDLQPTPVAVLGAAMGMGPQQHGMATVYRDNIATAAETQIMGDQLWAQSGLRPADIDVGIIYDHFSPAIFMQLEALGFCELGEAPDLVRDGGTEIDGVIPTNTNGGQLSEAYIHGFNGLAEAVRQLRGTAVNQVPDALHAVVTGASHVGTSGLLLRRSA